MSNDQPRYPVCAKCGMKIIPPSQRAWGTTWYCTCPKDPVPPSDRKAADVAEPNKNP